MTNKPVWLLDVDGVINAVVVERDFPSHWPAESWHLSWVSNSVGGMAWPIHWSSEVVSRINDLSERVDVRWHTTWQHDAAAELSQALGFKPFEVQSAPEFHRSLNMYEDAYTWWKMYAAVDVCNVEKRPLIWTDDDLNFYHKHMLKLDTADSGQSLCLITPFTDIGLRREDFELIEQFISEV